MNIPAPILLFTYLKLDTLKLTIESLKLNLLSIDSDFIIYHDGLIDDNYKQQHENVKSYLKSISGFKSIKIIESNFNKGLATSIINGVSEQFIKYEKLIILEDDLLLSKNFLSFINQGLEFYKNNDQILSICGYSPIIKNYNLNDVYFTKRSSSWGWATWKDRWDKVDWSFRSYDHFIRDRTQKKSFNKMGSDLTSMLIKQKSGLIDSWAIRFTYHQFRNNLFSVHPIISKVKNVGNNNLFAENTKQKNNRYTTILDNNNNNNIFIEKPFIDRNIINQFIKPNSLIVRILNKIYG
jgi:hypothetical protein